MERTNNLMAASAQWASRPDDQRYLSLQDLAKAVNGRREISTEKGIALDLLSVRAGEGNQMRVTDGEGVDAALTHWSFGQLCSRASAPAAYLRKLPAELAQIPLQWSLENAEREDGKLLLSQNGDTHVRAMTSGTYGRIWDSEVVNALLQRLDLDVWKVPAASYATSNPKKATTLYASDRDVFVFLVDDSHPIEVPGNDGADRLFRGFYCWNSEVGAAAFGITTFLYRYVCDNRIIWGAQDVKELRIRHTSGGPHRFMLQAQPMLRNYLEASTAGTVAAVKKARALEVGKTESDVVSWLQKRGFSAALSKRAAEKAAREPGNPRSVWNLVQGLTADAHDLTYTDDRVAVESKAGALLDAVAA